jgi:glycogen debranching enzyme
MVLALSRAMPTAQVRPDTLYAWSGPSLLLVNTRGECDADRLCGFYFHEARFLSRLVLEINGERPWRCEAVSHAPDELVFGYVHPEITQTGGGGSGQAGDEEGRDRHGIPERSLAIDVTLSVRVNRLDVRLSISNHARQAVTAELAWRVDADFADIQEAQGRREQNGRVDADARDDGVEFAYRHETLPYASRITGDGWRADAGGRRLTAFVTLAPQATAVRSIRVEPLAAGLTIDDNGAADRARTVAGWRESFTAIESPGNRVFEAACAANVRDVGSFPLLTGRRDEWLALQAGVPLYPAFFGRDAVTAGWQTALVDRGQSLDAALVRLGRLQSDRFDDWRDEEPGRIPYQVRTGPLAVLNLNPYSAYYADFASPLMFVVSLANLYAWTGDRACLAPHWDAARRILDWAREYGDADRDGYLEYHTRSSKGTKNQGWKDSGDAIVYDDGRPVPSPIATCELQGYWYIAQLLMAGMALAMGERHDASAYRREASALRRRFNRDWWVEGERSFALALDPDKRQVPAVTSNVGHCLATGIIDREHLPAVVGRLFAPDMFSGWGIRTLSSNHAFYNPISYHRGSVWAVEQATIVFGLRRFGFDARAADLARAVFDLCQLYPEYRIPETIGGYARGARATPGAYPRANTPQLWNASAFPLIVQSLLGLLPIAPLRTLVLDPALPTWLPEIVLRNLRVGGARVSLRCWRTRDGRSRWEVLNQHGTLHIVRQPPPESLSDGLASRAGAVADTLITRLAG